MRNYLAGNVVGATRDEVLAQQLINIIFCKIYDERFTKPEDMVTFRAGINEDKDEVTNRIVTLFNKVKNKYQDVLDKSDEISKELDADSIVYIVGSLQKYCLKDADRDAVGDAFEVFIDHALKGGQGQFFTPCNIVKMIVDMLDIKISDKIIDPCCGSGGFLVEALRNVWRKMDIEYASLNWPESEIEVEKQKIAIEKFRGIDKDYFLSKVCKAQMAILGDGRAGVFCENSLEKPNAWQSKTQEKIQLGTFDVVITNPPYGSKIKVVGNNILSQFELAYKWKYDSKKKGMPVWNWEIYDFNDFMSKLTFEKIEKSALETKIENDLIQNYGIVSDNISIFTNGIKMFCFDSMQNCSVVGYSDIQQLIENIKFDISKGPSNPAHSWITKINFDKHQEGTSDLSFYEGKKATPLDIARGTAVARPILEKEVMDSIEKNTVTVIKSSSGQGKTTLALKVAFLLQSNYTPYQLSCCNDIKEVGNIIQYFKVRTRLGEKPLIVLDNLDAHLSQWDKLVQIMQSNVSYNYKILITTREEDWYNFSGDISSIRSLNIIKPVLSEEEAKEIFAAFKLSGKVHSKILNWQSAWSKIADKQLLIEYIYLITHGEMLSERIFSQMKEIGNSSSGNVKFEILRKVCFADICGVKLNIYKLLSGLQEKSGCDSGELLKSMMDEFLVNVTMEGNYVEGLHPIRSQHIVERLHEYLPLENTAVDVMKIADKKDFSILFSHFPEFSFDKNKFYFDVVEFCGIELDLSQYVLALQGTFSGCVIQYFKQHKEMFDDANRHGGLFLIATELCPFAKFEELEEEMSTLEKILEIQPDNLNIKYLINLRDNTPRIDILQTDIYILCKELYRIFRNIKISDICDVDSYSIIVDWLYNIDHSFDLSHNLELESIWSNVENYSIETLSSLMYTKFCADKISYLKFVDSNKDCIFDYIMKNTRSHRVYETDNTNNIHVEYILRASNVREGNNESVSRLTNICKMLPIYEYYCSDSIKPEIDILSSYKVPDDAHKEMPKRNLVITFHQNFNSLWIKTIQSNYEFDSIYEWLEHWFLARSLICDCFDKSCLFIYKLLQNKSARNLGQEIYIIRGKYNELLIGECSYPRENRPFGEIGEPPKNFSNIKSDYFNSIQNCFMQLAGLIKRDKDAIRLFFYNFRVAKSCHSKMQSMFGDLDVGKYYIKNIRNYVQEKTKACQICICVVVTM